MKIKELKAQKTLSIRIKTPVQELPKKLGEGYGEIMQYINELGVQPVGAPYAKYYNQDMSNLDIEMGFPIAGTQPDKGRIKSMDIHSDKVVTTVHVGPYTDLEKTYKTMLSWAKDNGYTMKEYCYEFYINDPCETPPDKLETEINLPIL